ncbi:N-carbamoyl-D-amino-acid hydrolase [Mesorhizobium sp.]|uniref:N-carbamoyl-D-amino-acid hydrolase n=1 Tax=Mesorhizobium sp. TaxID=1871066 RepID=UPI000FE6B494|nr:N-carbamoyl-D-amino-acid hydrolase [Mesorhizobium sp.]RWI87938.1 MAG: N-carbamoyl-D-amino-acid hydrolase [Mesorhizobium sp.]
MQRQLKVAVGQLGPIGKREPRGRVVNRLIELMRKARNAGCSLIVFPEMALTTFFARWYMEDEAELDSYFETAMPNTHVQSLFDESARLGIGFYLGYAELDLSEGRRRRFNSSILVDANGQIIGKYRKVHMPGHVEFKPERSVQHLEKRYFEPGNLGFPVWRCFGGIMGMCLCFDRRWPETYRVMGLQGVEMVLVGYNTPAINRDAAEPNHLKMFHNHLTMQAGAYQNGTWVVAAAKAGNEDGFDMLGGSCIISPAGEIVAKTYTLGDEIAYAECDLEMGRYIKNSVFDFTQYRQPEHYKLIVERRGAMEPPLA